MAQIIEYDPNTGRKLNAGESVLNKETGQIMTQGRVYGEDTPDTTLKNTQDTPISSVFGSQSEDDKALEKAREAQYGMIQDSANYNPDIDDPIIRAKAISSVQSEIDALNKAAAEQKAEIARRLGIQSTGELGNQRALLAGSGMLGQVSGAAEKSNLMTAQEERLQGYHRQVDIATSSAISALMAEARKSANEEILAKKKAYSESPQAIIDYLTTKKERTAENINSIVSKALLNNIDLSDASLVKNLALSMNVNSSDLSNAYKLAKAEQDALNAEAEAQAQKEAIEQEKILAETLKLKAEAYKLNNPEDKLMSVDGGLFNATKNVWVVYPKDKADEYIFDKDGNIFNKTKGVYAKTGTMEAPAGVAKDLSGYDNTVTTIDELLKDTNDRALKQAVSSNPLAHIEPWENWNSGKKNFIASVEQLISTSALDALVAAKARGATFGALSDREMNLLKAAASKIGTWTVTDKNGKVIGYDIDPENFKKELNKLKASAEKLKEYALREQGLLESGSTSTTLPETKEYDVNGIIYTLGEDGKYYPKQ